jgi:hypothetical protein
MRHDSAHLGGAVLGTGMSGNVNHVSSPVFTWAWSVATLCASPSANNAATSIDSCQRLRCFLCAKRCSTS